MPGDEGSEAQGSGVVERCPWNWKAVEVLCAAGAALAASERHGPGEIIPACAEEYAARAKEMVYAGTWVPGVGGDPPVDESVKWRTRSIPGGNPGAMIWERWLEVKKEVVTYVLPALASHLTADGELPEGKAWADILEVTEPIFSGQTHFLLKYHTYLVITGSAPFLFPPACPLCVSSFLPCSSLFSQQLNLFQDVKNDFWKARRGAPAARKDKPMPMDWNPSAWKVFLAYGPASEGGGISQFGVHAAIQASKTEAGGLNPPSSQGRPKRKAEGEEEGQESRRAPKGDAAATPQGFDPWQRVTTRHGFPADDVCAPLCPEPVPPLSVPVSYVLNCACLAIIFSLLCTARQDLLGCLPIPFTRSLRIHHGSFSFVYC